MPAKKKAVKKAAKQAPKRKAAKKAKKKAVKKERKGAVARMATKKHGEGDDAMITVALRGAEATRFAKLLDAREQSGAAFIREAMDKLG